MGACLTSADAGYYQHGAADEWRGTFEKLQLSPGEINALYRKFMKFDEDKSHTISIWELLDAMVVERTPFAEKVFGVFDDKHDGELTFGELVVNLWHYCTSTEASLCSFAFDMYCKDETIMTEEELKLFLEDTFHGSETQKGHGGQLHMVTTLGEFANSARLTQARFSSFAEEHKNMLFPLFSLQKSMQHAFCGEGFWKTIGKKRMAVTECDSLDIKVVLATVSMKEFVARGGVRGEPAPSPHRSEETNAHHHHRHHSSNGSAVGRSGVHHGSSSSADGGRGGGHHKHRHHHHASPSAKVHPA